MPTDFAIDDELLAEALRLGGQRTKKDIVDQALREFIDRRRQTKIVDLFGKIDIDPEHEQKAQRRRS